jgi:TIR domain-containing protein
LVSALQAWDVDYWFDVTSMDAGGDLSKDILQAIAACDIFIRICTKASQGSYWVRLESAAARGLAAESPAGRHNGNTFIIELDASAPNFHAYGVMYFTPSLRTFTFT